MQGLFYGSFIESKEYHYAIIYPRSKPKAQSFN